MIIYMQKIKIAFLGLKIIIIISNQIKSLPGLKILIINCEVKNAFLGLSRVTSERDPHLISTKKRCAIESHEKVIRY